jgi:DNA-binding beta-propeller fold protein YncE
MVRIAALVVALVSAVTGAPPAAGAQTVAVLGSGGARALPRVDPATLALLPGSQPVPLPRHATFALSPDSTRIAVATEREIVIADSRSGRVVRRIRNEGFDVSEGLYWVGSSGRPRFVAVGESGLGWEYTGIPSDVATIDTELGGGDFEAAWAGNDRIAVWGANGLGVIDTRGWTTSSLAPAATGAAATRYGIVAWNANAADGATVFARDGRRLHVLTGKTVRHVAAFGRYAYARVAASQYSVDLTTGRVRRIRADAAVEIPSLVSLP